jgi:hypothetical protein
MICGLLLPPGVMFTFIARFRRFNSKAMVVAAPREDGKRQMLPNFVSLLKKDANSIRISALRLASPDFDASRLFL